MTILPAIDLKGGVCVRLRQGRADDVTTYNDAHRAGASSMWWISTARLRALPAMQR